MKAIILAVLVMSSFFLLSTTKKSKEKYQCMPCGQACDKAIFDEPGKCSQCHMDLVKSATVTFKSIDPETICAYLKSHPKTLLLDVRTKPEFEGKADPNFGTLKNAINIPIQELKNRISELNTYKKQEILVYCSHSHRSPQASYLLTQNGFGKIVNLNGGMSKVSDAACKK